MEKTQNIILPCTAPGITRACKNMTIDDNYWAEHQPEDEYVYTLNTKHSGVITSRTEFPDVPNSAELYININMMPYIIGLEETTIPKKYHRYLKMISECNVSILLNGTIGYLTIQESFVKKGMCQRRPGLHVEAPRIECDKDNQVLRQGTHSWGGGLLGGIIMGSNIPESLEVYPCQIKDAGISKHGCVEEYRDLLQNRVVNEENKLFHITDHTPHESLPVKRDCVRQFFRLVVGDIDVWYKEHSTENELGIVPGINTKIVLESKFS